MKIFLLWNSSIQNTTSTYKDFCENCQNCFYSSNGLSATTSENIKMNIWVGGQKTWFLSPKVTTLMSQMSGFLMQKPIIFQPLFLFTNTIRYLISIFSWVRQNSCSNSLYKHLFLEKHYCWLHKGEKCIVHNMFVINNFIICIYHYWYLSKMHCVWNVEVICYCC